MGWCRVGWADGLLAGKGRLGKGLGFRWVR